MELQGIFKQKSEIKTFESGFQTQEFYLDLKRFNPNTGEPIENLLRFQITRSTAFENLKDLEKGDEVKVSFNVQGRLYDKKDGTGKGHIQNLEAWKIEKVIKDQPQGQSSQPSDTNDNEDDDLPF
jgi:hypothetical protein